METKPFYFSAPATLTDPGEEGIPLKFTGIPYSGAVMSEYGYPTVIDLATTTAIQTMPLLQEHDREDVIGVVKECSVGSDIRVSGDIFSDIDEDAKLIALKAQRGIPWQMSVGLFEPTREDVPVGKTIECNGAMLSGPLIVLRNGVVREVSIVALGADKQTSAQFFTAPSGNPPNEDSMSDAEISSLKTQVAELSEKLTAAEARATAAENQHAALLLSARKQSISALFAELGREVTDESTAVYLSMSDDAFTAISKDMLALKSKDDSQHAHLFSEQATGDMTPRNQAPVIDTAAIYAARRAN